MTKESYVKKTIIVVFGAAGLVLAAACGSSDTGSDQTADVEDVEILEESEVGAPDLPTDDDGDIALDASDEQFAADTALSDGLPEVRDHVGVPASGQVTINMWRPTACQMAESQGVSDSEAAGHMVTDLEGQVELTAEQAEEIWQVAKTTC